MSSASVDSDVYTCDLPIEIFVEELAKGNFNEESFSVGNNEAFTLIVKKILNPPTNIIISTF